MKTVLFDLFNQKQAGPVFKFELFFISCICQKPIGPRSRSAT